MCCWENHTVFSRVSLRKERGYGRRSSGPCGSGRAWRAQGVREPRRKRGPGRQAPGWPWLGSRPECRRSLYIFLKSAWRGFCLFSSQAEGVSFLKGCNSPVGVAFQGGWAQEAPLTPYVGSALRARRFEGAHVRETWAAGPHRSRGISPPTPIPTQSPHLCPFPASTALSFHFTPC